MANFDVLMDDVNLFGEPYEDGLKKPSTQTKRKSADGNTHSKNGATATVRKRSRITEAVASA